MWRYRRRFRIDTQAFGNLRYESACHTDYELSSRRSRLPVFWIVRRNDLYIAAAPNAMYEVAIAATGDKHRSTEMHAHRMVDAVVLGIAFCGCVESRLKAPPISSYARLHYTTLRSAIDRQIQLAFVHVGTIA